MAAKKKSTVKKTAKKQSSPKVSRALPAPPAVGSSVSIDADGAVVVVAVEPDTK